MKKIQASVILLFSLALSAETYEEIYSKAQMLRTEKKYAEAVGLLEKIQNHPEQYRIYQQIAESCLAAAAELKAEKKDENESAIREYALKAEKNSRMSVELKDDFADGFIALYNAQNTLGKMEDSADTLYTLVEMYPDNPEYLYLLGSIHYNNLNNIVMAKYCFDMFYNLSFEQNIPAQYVERVLIALSEINYELKNYSDSIANLKSAIEYNSANSERMLKLASYLASINQLDAAAGAYEVFYNQMKESEKKSDLGYTVCAFIGAVYYAKGDSRGLEYMKKAVKDGKYENPFIRAVLAGNDSSSEAVLENLRKAMSSDQTYVPVFISAAKLCERKGDNGSAAMYYSKAGEILSQTDLYLASAKINRKAAIMGDNPVETFRRAAASFEKAKLPANALVMLRNAVNSRFSMEDYLYAAYLHTRVGLKDDYKKIMADAKLREPGNFRVYYVSALTEFDMGDYKASLDDVLKAVKINPEDPYCHFHAGITYEKLGKLNEAAAEMEEALKYDKENPGYLNFLGYIYADKNIRLDKAEEMIRSALSKEPNNGAFLDSLGWLEYRKGNYQDSLKYLYRGMQNLKAANNEDSVVYEHLGFASEKLGKKKQALKYWNKALSMKKNPQIEKKVRDVSKVN